MEGFLSQYGMILFLVGIGAVFYFLMIRPAKKQQQKQQAMMDSLQEGSRVMLTSGIYGTIRHLGDRQAIIEISPGVDLTVLRRAVAKIATSDEEEFEYADATEPDGSLPGPGEPDPAPTGWSLADLPEAPDEPAAPAEAAETAEPDEKN
jgi:preprotein translocase subunit YajC